MNAELLAKAKSLGFSDRQIANLTGRTEDAVRAERKQLGLVPSYRLAPKNPFPAQIEDVAAAFAWSMQHAAEWGGDTNRVFVGGHSAGGHLSALLALDRRYLDAAGAPPVPIRSPGPHPRPREDRACRQANPPEREVQDRPS